MVMTQHKDRKAKIRARMAATGEPYSVAARALLEHAAATEVTAAGAPGFSPEKIPVGEFPFPPGAAVLGSLGSLYTVVDRDGFAFLACCAAHDREGKASGWYPQAEHGRMLAELEAAGGAAPDHCGHPPGLLKDASDEDEAHREQAVREHMAATGQPYTDAARSLDAPFKEGYISISERMAEADQTYAEAVAFLSDPANETMCETCGWTYGMVCPECTKGCGCETRCSGWRHHEFRHEDEESGELYCEECGADSHYQCDCDYELA
jgi:hypothetical protein